MGLCWALELIWVLLGLILLKEELPSSGRTGGRQEGVAGTGWLRPASGQKPGEHGLLPSSSLPVAEADQVASSLHVNTIFHLSRLVPGTAHCIISAKSEQKQNKTNKNVMNCNFILTFNV